MFTFCGSSARIFTTLQEVDDPIIASSYVISTVCNGILVFQILLFFFFYSLISSYWKKTEELKNKKEEYKSLLQTYYNESLNTFNFSMIPLPKVRIPGSLFLWRSMICRKNDPISGWDANWYNPSSILSFLRATYTFSKKTI